jgi:hypothetical protein
LEESSGAFIVCDKESKVWFMAKKFLVYGVWCLWFFFGSIIPWVSSEEEICSAFSAGDADDFWFVDFLKIYLLMKFLFFFSIRDSLGRCPSCTSLDACGYCLSTLQCIPGTADGPMESSYPCPSWTFVQDGCPGKLEVF